VPVAGGGRESGRSPGSDGTCLDRHHAALRATRREPRAQRGGAVRGTTVTQTVTRAESVELQRMS
jgi:hypothetical protein